MSALDYFFAQEEVELYGLLIVQQNLFIMNKAQFCKKYLDLPLASGLLFLKCCSSSNKFSLVL